MNKSCLSMKSEKVGAGTLEDEAPALMFSVEPVNSVISWPWTQAPRLNSYSKSPSVLCFDRASLTGCLLMAPVRRVSKIESVLVTQVTSVVPM